jgi:chemotaxis protein histidine kinase CheA
MATLSEYFDTEARVWLAQLERGVDRAPLPDTGELHRAIRALRGTAQMAREERVYRAASAFEAAMRELAVNARSWNDDVADRARETLADLRALVMRHEEDRQLEDRLDAVIGRWQSIGVPMPPHVSGMKKQRASPLESSGRGEFRVFAAREVEGIADALDRGVQQLAAASMDREALKMILRRQRALLGAARLEEIPVVAEILRALEDLTRVIAKLDVGVKQEWLDIYRVAREGLKATIGPLQRDEDPPPSHALSRLRHMREELLERYGTGEAVSAADESAGLVQATPFDQPPTPIAYADDDARDGLHDVADADDSRAEPVAGAGRQDWLDDDDDVDDDVLELGTDDVLFPGAALTDSDTGADAADDVVQDITDEAGDATGDETEHADDTADNADDSRDADDAGVPDVRQVAADAMERAAAVAQPAASLAAGMAMQVAGAVSSAVSGAAEAVRAPADDDADVDDAADDDVASDDDVVPIEDLVYTGDAALDRVLELRTVLERVAGDDPEARAAVEELVDLVRLARGG